MNKTVGAAIQSLPLVVGVDLGGIEIRAAVLRGNQLLSRIVLPIGTNPAPEHVIPCISEAVQKTIQQAAERTKVTFDQIEGVGIGVPGLLNNEAGIVYFMPNLAGWDHVPLRDKLEENFKKRVFIDNDANAAALGEYLFGAGRGCNFMVYLTIGSGLGGGVIMNGQIMRGVSGTAMEIGHMVINEEESEEKSGEPCNCGNFGCLESVASGTAIARRANEVFGPPLRQQLVVEPSWLIINDIKKIVWMAENGVPEARDIIENAAEALGIGLVNVIHIFNPERIILGGSLIQIGPPLLDPARRIVQERAMEVPRKAVRIVETQLRQNVGLVGAGALVYHNMGMSIKLSQQEP